MVENETSEDRQMLANRSNDRDGYVLPDHWMIPRCDNTGLWWLDHEAYVARVCEIVKESGAKTVLEAGCGDGWNCQKLVEQGLDVVGCDWSQNGIEHARRLVPDARFYCGDLTDPEFEQAYGSLFDAVIFVEVIEHIPPDECVAALANVVRMLRPGGTFVLTTPSVNQPNTNPQHYRHFDEATLRGVVSAVQGMQVVAIEGYGDAVFSKTFDRIMRLIDNRIYRVKPLKEWWDNYYRERYARHRPTDRCRGLILTAIKRSDADKVEDDERP